MLYAARCILHAHVVCCMSPVACCMLHVHILGSLFAAALANCSIFAVVGGSIERIKIRRTDTAGAHLFEERSFNVLQLTPVHAVHSIRRLRALGQSVCARGSSVCAYLHPCLPLSVRARARARERVCARAAFPAAFERSACCLLPAARAHSAHFRFRPPHCVARGVGQDRARSLLRHSAVAERAVLCRAVRRESATRAPRAPQPAATTTSTTGVGWVPLGAAGRLSEHRTTRTHPAVAATTAHQADLSTRPGVHMRAWPRPTC